MQIAFERLLDLNKEYEEKLEMAKEFLDKERVIHYEGACEGLKVAITAFAPYFAKE